MKRTIVFLLAAALFFCGADTAFAKSVTVSGIGMTAQEAENDALRNAVENTLGVLVDAETLVDKNVLISDQIYTNSRGFITNYSVREKIQTENGWRVTIDADIDESPDSKLMNTLTRLGIIDNRLRNPKIAVYIPEHHLQYRVPDPACETAVVNSFLAAGFTNVIEGSGTTPSGGWQTKSYANMTADDMKSAANFFAADIVIMGEAFSEGVGDVGQWLPGTQRTGLQSCRARAEAKMYIARTGQIIAADGKYGSAADISQAIASKKALAAAGKNIGEYLVAELINNFGAGNRQGMEVVVIGADYAKVRVVQSALNGVRGAKNVQLSSYADGRGVFMLHYGGSPQTLFGELNAACDAELTLESAAYNTLTVRVR